MTVLDSFALTTTAASNGKLSRQVLQPGQVESCTEHSAVLRLMYRFRAREEFRIKRVETCLLRSRWTDRMRCK